MINEPETAAADRRRAQLLVAAEAMRSWVREQRAGWSNRPDARVIVSSPPRVATAEATLAVPSPLMPVPVPPAGADGRTTLHPPELGGERRRKEWQVGAGIASLTRGGVAAIATVGRPLLRWSTRLAAAVLLLGLLGGAGWKAREYWLERTTSSDQRVADPRSTAPSSTAVPGAPVRTGRLEVESEPPGAKVFVDGRTRGVTPLTVDSLPVGTHVIVLQSEKGTVRRTVSIMANETARLSESIYTGWLAVASPIEVSISEGTQTLRQDERDRFVLSPGSHELVFENRALGYREIRHVDIRPGEVARLSVTPPASTLTVNSSVPAAVAIDGERIGETPISAHPINLGTRDVIVTAASGGERRFTITVTAAPVKLDVDFSR